MTIHTWWRLTATGVASTLLIVLLLLTACDIPGAVEIGELHAICGNDGHVAIGKKENVTRVLQKCRNIVRQ